MRASLFRPVETSLASAPVCSQSRAISLMKVMDSARKRIQRVLHHLRRFGAHEDRLRRERLKKLFQQRLLGIMRMPTIARSAFSKASIALPSRRFSGEQAKWNCGNSFSSFAQVPTGNWAEIKTSAPTGRCGSACGDGRGPNPRLIRRSHRPVCRK